MSKLQERESRRKSIVADMVSEPSTPVPGGRGRPKENREKKKNVTFSVLPSLYEDIKKIAYVQRRSFSEVVSELLEQYRQAHKDIISEYESVKK
jgi:predicted CopG family antitoxin